MVQGATSEQNFYGRWITSATQWHTRGTRNDSGERFGSTMRPRERRAQYLVMMGSGVRVPASALPVGKSLQTGAF